jgi:endonuclease/exonuclease/phosphatase family metal-dependent hydrolase
VRSGESKEVGGNAGEAVTLRFVTYNVHKGIGGIDRRCRLDRTAEVLRSAEPDICLLQEVDEGCARSRFERQVDVLGDALGMPHRAYAPNHRLTEGHYGNAILSKVPFRSSHNLSLTLPLHKKRSALHARFLVEGVRHGLWVFNCHLGLAEAERRQQLRRILRFIDEHHGSQETVVVMGDFNDVWNTLGPTVLMPAGFRSVVPPPLTFPAIRPLRPLDRVFVRGRIQITQCDRIDGPIARQASDHLPVAAELRVLPAFRRPR